MQDTFQGFSVGNRVRHIATGQLGTIREIRAGKPLVKQADFGIAWDARGGAVFSAQLREIEHA